MAKGSISVLKSVISTDAFVNGSDVEVTLKQPKKSFLKNVYIRIVAAPTVTASQDLGFKIGTSTGGTQLGSDADGIIDNAGSTTPLTVGTVIDCHETLAFAAGGSGSRTKVFYSHDERDLFLNTSATAAAIAVAGTVEFVCEFGMLED